ncbi:MAG: response regulator transcription factor [Candidatus Saccharibacteria bacterium]|nr:response regulator transcription factor [Candidatus Saccharibacteria bacterium]
MRILYVEDEKFLADAVCHNLVKNGIDVDHSADGEDGLEKAVSNSYDCIVLDIMLPKLSGIEILERLREKKNSTPVIMLSALAEVEDKVRGLDSGADDYLAKPFKTVELIARINALLRRPSKMSEQILTFGDLSYDEKRKTLNGTELTAKEAKIICELIKANGRLISKEFLLGRIWGEDSYGDDNYIEVYISRLRKVMREVGARTQIKASRGLGYKLVEM